MHVAQRRTLGRTGIDPSLLSFGAAPIGNFLRPFREADARGMVDQAWELGIRYYDTAPLYGHGLSEYRLGHALRERPRQEFFLSTKVGRVLRPAAPGTFDSGLWTDPAPFAVTYDYSYDGVLRSVEDSLQRLLVDRVDILLLHDIDRYTHGDAQPDMFETAMTGGARALERLRDEGVTKAIGVGVNEADVCAEALRRMDADCALLAGRYTLLEQEPLDDLLPLCLDRGIGVILGGVYNSGVLATGPKPGAKFNYAPAPPDILQRAGRLQAICDRHHVPLPAVALQFAAAHPAVASICIGSRTPDQQAATAQWLETLLPAELWQDLRSEGLVREDAPTA
ncbi:aldo/keto reductase [Amycolatopsis benzoatilytica]|uniref:aldo/keto reductase n=1 Tax=Amycolatopsis benzoatilytica TaxID=346045 RepID=UPI000377A3CE|nr:aldo/keto reductase [Amycolatopsis benzoatilytica]